jgi:hypothetical protein
MRVPPHAQGLPEHVVEVVCSSPRFIKKVDIEKIGLKCVEEFVGLKV